MDERSVVERTSGPPATVASLASDLRALGVRSGMLVLVHSSLSALGWVCGGAAAVLYALDDAVGPTGTIVMPSHTGDLTDPEDWRRPPVPAEWKPLIRSSMPAYDSARTPTRGMGVIAETFRTWPEILRSAHPHCSFAARGPLAHGICDGHALDFGLGEGSPLARIYDRDGWVLLLGVGHASNTSIHLAEYRSEWKGRRTTANAAPILVRGRRAWITVRDLALSSDDFDMLGAAFGAVPGRVVSGRVGAGVGLLMRQRDLVDFATPWLATHRGSPREPEVIRIRAVVADDCAEWIGLRSRLWPECPAEQHAGEVADWLVDPRKAAYVACDASGRLCGLIEVALRDGAEGCTSHPVGYIEGWFVDAEFRGRGVGRRLAEAGEVWAREHGCTEMASDATTDYPNSPAAHAGAGYERVLVTLHYRKAL